MTPMHDPTRPGAWGLALFLALLLHVGVVVGAHALRLFTLPMSTPAASPEIDVVFAPPPERREPTTFSELPPDRADEKPDRPDFLSNVDSRARDRVVQGDAPLPRLEGESEAPHVAMVPAGRPRAAPQLPARSEIDSRENPHSPRASLLHDILRESLAADTRDAQPSADGGNDFFQEAMSYTSGNAALSGDISLSTTAWDFAPWLVAFRRAVSERWHPPGAYFMGLIHGWVKVEVEIAPDGQLRDVRVLEAEVGHESLASAAVFALKYAAPYRPLPSDFPDESLILKIKFVYPILKTGPERRLRSSVDDRGPRAGRGGTRP